jgi:hypothetical protein
MRRFMLALVSCLFATVSLAAPPPEPAAGPGKVSGSYSVDGKTVELKYVYAMSQPNTFDEKKTDTAILLTDQPVADAELAGAKDLGRVAIAKGRNSVLFEIDETGRAMREVVRHESLGENSLQMSGMTHADVKLASRTADRVEGSAETKEPEDFVKHKYAIHAKFSAPIRAAHRDAPLPDAKSGKKLPKGGGEPGKAYLAFEDMIRKKDIAGLRKLKPQGVADMSDEDLKAGLEIMAAMTPEKISVDDGYIDGDLAVLYVSGVRDGQKSYATVRMTKGDGVWRATDQKWSDKPPAR